jgi:hypothetical protein
MVMRVQLDDNAEVKYGDGDKSGQLPHAARGSTGHLSSVDEM